LAWALLHCYDLSALPALVLGKSAMSLRRASLSIAVAITALSLGSLAVATPITVVTTGTIGYGYDTTGTFGGASGTYLYLTGDSYTLTTTLDPTTYQYSTAGTNYAYWYGNIPSFTETLTIGGITFTDTASTDASGQTYLQDPATATGTGDDEPYQYDAGYDANYNTVYALQYFTSPNATGLTLNPYQVFSYSPGASDSAETYYDFYGLAGQIFFYSEDNYGYPGTGSVSELCLNTCTTPITSVPEPGPAGLAGVALALLGLLAFRPRRVRLP
jgi:hypothetical protein